METLNKILSQEQFTKEDLIYLLNLKDANHIEILFNKAYETKLKFVDNIVHLRGLIELSNICRKDCFYCGIRKSNKNVERYMLSKKQVLDSVKFAYENNLYSVVIQGGERSDKKFINFIDDVLKEISEKYNNQIRVTLSCGEQTMETYTRWFESGAKRYLLRIEATNPDLYKKIHPNNSTHSFEKRLDALKMIKAAGYQTGTGVMIGLPFQTVDDLANDLLFFKEFDIDMAGMGPYIEHPDTPLYQFKNELLPLKDRFLLSLKMVALLRILMKDINIASTTALQAIDEFGREKGLKAGANVIMPNITPQLTRKQYQLYSNKPCLDESPDVGKKRLELKIKLAGERIIDGNTGDSKHYNARNKNS